MTRNVCGDNMSPKIAAILNTGQSSTHTLHILYIPRWSFRWLVGCIRFLGVSSMSAAAAGSRSWTSANNYCTKTIYKDMRHTNSNNVIQSRINSVSLRRTVEGAAGAAAARAVTTQGIEPCSLDALDRQ